MVTDMTKGKPLTHIIYFSLPILLGNLFQQLYQMTDILIVGRLLGEKALASVGASIPIFLIFLILAFSFTMGLTAVTAQRFGAKDEKGVRLSVTHSIRAGIVLSVILTALMLGFLKPMLRLLNVPTEIMSDAYRFTFILGCGIFLVVAFNLLSGFIRALGDSKTSLYFLIFSSFMNIAFNFLFIKVMHFGVEGSALGTLIAIAISVICCSIYIVARFPILKLSKADWEYRPNFMKQHLNIAIPMSIQFSLLALSIIITQAVCNTFGAQAIVGFTIALRIEQLAIQPMIAIGASMATFSAQNYGAGKIGRIRTATKKSCLLTFLISIVLSAVIFISGKTIIRGFLPTAAPLTITVGSSYLNISILFYCFLGFILIFKNTLQSTGKPFYPVTASFVEVAVRIFSLTVLVEMYGYTGLYIASPLAWIAGSAVAFIGYIRNYYQKNDTAVKAEYRLIFHKKSNVSY